MNVYQWIHLGIQYVHITHLEWFTNSNDAPQSATVVTEHTLSSPHRDFLFTNIYLPKQRYSYSTCGLFLQVMCLTHQCTSYYLYDFVIEGHLVVFDPCVGDVV